MNDQSINQGPGGRPFAIVKKQKTFLFFLLLISHSIGTATGNRHWAEEEKVKK